MKPILLFFGILLMIFLSGCESIPDRPSQLEVLQRFIDLDFVEVNGEMYIDPRTSFCVERIYRHSLEFVGPIEKFRNVPIEKCDKMTGYNPVDYVEVHLFLEDVRREISGHE